MNLLGEVLLSSSKSDWYMQSRDSSQRKLNRNDHSLQITLSPSQSNSEHELIINDSLGSLAQNVLFSSAKLPFNQVVILETNLSLSYRTHRVKFNLQYY